MFSKGFLKGFAFLVFFIRKALLRLAFKGLLFIVLGFSKVWFSAQNEVGGAKAVVEVIL